MEWKEGEGDETGGCWQFILFNSNPPTLLDNRAGGSVTGTKVFFGIPGNSFIWSGYFLEVKQTIFFKKRGSVVGMRGPTLFASSFEPSGALDYLGIVR